MSILQMLAKAVWDLVRALFQSIGAVTRNLFHPLWLAFRGVFKFKADEVKRPLVALVSIIVIVASLISIYLSQRSPTAKINLKPFEGLGEVVAEKTAQLLQDRGDVVLVMLQVDNPNMTALTTPPAAFRATLKSHPGIRIRATENVTMQPQAMLGPTTWMTADQFIALIEKHATADAIVSFAGVPPLQPGDWDRIPRRRPKIVDAGAFTPQIRELIEKEIVHVAIQPRFKASTETKEPVTPREWFDRYYMVVTPQNISEVPEYAMPPISPPPPPPKN